MGVSYVAKAGLGIILDDEDVAKLDKEKLWDGEYENFTVILEDFGSGSYGGDEGWVVFLKEKRVKITSNTPDYTKTIPIEWDTIGVSDKDWSEIALFLRDIGLIDQDKDNYDSDLVKYLDRIAFHLVMAVH